MTEDNVVILSDWDDEDSTIFQSNEDRENLLNGILDDDDDTIVDATNPLKPNLVKSNSLPYWQQVFG